MESSSLYFEQFKMLTYLAVPMVGNAMLTVVTPVITSIYVGRLNSATLMGASTLGNMMCNITGYSVAFGMCAALDTLIAQAYGAQRFDLVGIHTQRAIVILTLFSFPVAIIWSITDKILYYALDIDKETSDLSGVWARHIVYGLWPTLMFQILRKYLQGCNIVWPSLLANVAGAVTNAGATYYMIYVLQWGYAGAALGVVVSQWVTFITILAIIAGLHHYSRYAPPLSPLGKELQFQPLPQVDSLEEGAYSHAKQIEMVSTPFPFPESDSVGQADSIASDTYRDETSVPQNDFFSSHGATAPSLSLSPYSPSSSYFLPSFPIHETWPPVVISDIFQNWGLFLGLAIPSGMSLFLEWGSFELMASISGHLGSVSLATHGVYMTTASLFYMTPLAISDATSTLTGNYLGQGSVAEAKRIVKLGMFCDMLWGTFAGALLLFVLRPYWGPLFTEDEDVKHLIYDTIPIMFVYIAVDSMKCVTLNLLRSTGRPSITTIGNIVSCLFVMVPLGYYLGILRGYGLWGIWGAMSLGWLVATIFYFLIIVFTDWNVQAQVAKQRNSESNGVVSTSSHAM